MPSWKKKTLIIAVAIPTVVASYIVGAYLARKGMDWIRRAPSISADAIGRSWSHQILGDTGIEFDSPWPLETATLELPPEAAKTIAGATTLRHEGDGMSLFVRHSRLQPTVVANLDQVADGTVDGLRGVRGTVAVNITKEAATVIGQPAVKLEGRIERERGGALEIRGLVFGQDRDLYLIEFICNADQSSAIAVWKKLSSSIRWGRPPNPRPEADRK